MGEASVFSYASTLTRNDYFQASRGYWRPRRSLPKNKQGRGKEEKNFELAGKSPRR